MDNHFVDKQQQSYCRHKRCELVGVRDKAKRRHIDHKADDGRSDDGAEKNQRGGRCAKNLQNHQAGVSARNRRTRIGQIDFMHDAEDKRETDAQNGVSRAE